MRYHGRRKAFLGFLTRLDPALTVVLGGAAFTTIVAGNPEYRTWAAGAALFAAVISALNLAFGLGDRTRLHEDLFRSWGMLRADLAELPDGDEGKLRRLEAKRAQIDAESPWQLLALSVLCENEEKRMRREGELIVWIGFKDSWQTG